MEKVMRFCKNTSVFCVTVLALCLSSGAESWGEPYFSDDMESAVMWNADVPWATTIAESHSASTAWTDSPGTYYEPLSDVSLTLTDPLDLSSATQPQLVFWHKYQIETDFDLGAVEISTDGGVGWDLLHEVTGISSWKREQLDLTGYAGQGNVLLRFRLITDKTIAWRWVVYRRCYPFRAPQCRSLFHSGQSNCHLPRPELDEEPRYRFCKLQDLSIHFLGSRHKQHAGNRYCRSEH